MGHCEGKMVVCLYGISWAFGVQIMCTYTFSGYITSILH